MTNDTKPLVAVDAPILTPAADLTYVIEDTGSMISWVISGIYILAPAYTIYCGETVLQSGVWGSGENISISVDGLEVGTHTYKISVRDGTAWGKSEGTIRVTVLAYDVNERVQIIVGLSYWLGLGGLVALILIIKKKR